MINKLFTPERLTRTLGIIFSIFMVSQLISRNDFRINDEAVNLTMAKNMGVNKKFVTYPSYEPHEYQQNWKEHSLKLILMPPVYAYLVYKVSNTFKISTFRSAALLQGLFLILFLFILYLHSEQKNFLSKLLLLLMCPKVYEYLTNFEHEGMLIAFGFAAVMGSKKEGLHWSVITGSILGVCFLAKTWLAGPFVLGVSANLIYKYIFEQKNIKKFFIQGITISLFFLLVASSHLLFVYLKDPTNLNAWINQVYLGVFKSGVNSKFSSTLKNGWANQWWYYFGVMLRENFLLLSTLFISLQNKTQVFKLLNIKNLPFTVVFLCFIPLSFIHTKEPAYILPSLLSTLFLIDLTAIKINKTTFCKIFLIGLFVVFTNLNIGSKYVKEIGFFINIGYFFLLAILFNKWRKSPISTLMLCIFSIVFSFYYLNEQKHQFNEVKNISSIMNEDSDLSSNNQICALEYAMYGYYTGKKVIKYSWLFKYTSWVTKTAKFIVLPKKQSLSMKKESLEILKDKYFPIKNFKYYTLFKRKDSKPTQFQ